VDEFSCSLLNPLKSDMEFRHAFADSLDHVMDAAIEMEQKKTLAHPVLHRLMNNKWFGEFRTLKRSSSLSIQYWKWCFLNIWCVIDVLLFPVLFVLFYIIHICRNRARRKRGNLLKLVVFIFRLLISSVRAINPQISICLMEMLLMIRFLRHSRSLRKLRECSPKLPLMFIFSFVLNKLRNEGDCETYYI